MLDTDSTFTDDFSEVGFPNTVSIDQVLLSFMSVDDADDY